MLGFNFCWGSTVYSDLYTEVCIDNSLGTGEWY